MENDIKLGPAGDVQLLSAFGRKYDWAFADGLARQERASSGKLRKDIWARKKIFLLAYDTLDQDVADRAEVLYNIDDELTLEVTHLGVTETYQVLLSPYSQSRLLAVWGGMWEGVTLELSEV